MYFLFAKELGIRPKEVRKMESWERALLEDGLERYLAEISADPSEGGSQGTPQGGSRTLNLDALAELGAEVS